MTYMKSRNWIKWHLFYFTSLMDYFAGTLGREKSHIYVYLEFCTYNTISLVLSLLRCTCIYTLTIGKSTCSEMQCWFHKLNLIFKCFEYFCLLQISTVKWHFETTNLAIIDLFLSEFFYMSNWKIKLFVVIEKNII
jgi:hypothetical protein